MKSIFRFRFSRNRNKKLKFRFRIDRNRKEKINIPVPVTRTGIVFGQILYRVPVHKTPFRSYPITVGVCYSSTTTTMLLRVSLIHPPTKTCYCMCLLFLYHPKYVTVGVWYSCITTNLQPLAADSILVKYSW